MNDGRAETIDAGSALIVLMMKTVSLDATDVVGHFRETVFTEHEHIDLEVQPRFALVDTLTEQFEPLTGRSIAESPLLQMDRSAYDSFETWARQVGLRVVEDDSFSWDWQAAEQHHHNGGVDPIPMGMLALDEWLEPHGFRFVGVDDHSDSYYGFALQAAELQRALDVAVRADIDLYLPARFMLAELVTDLLDANSIRAKSFSRRRKGYDRREVDSHLVSIAERVERQSPTQSFHLTCSGQIEKGTAFSSVVGGYDIEEVNSYIGELVAQSRRV